MSEKKPDEWNHNAVAIRVAVPPIPTPEEWEASVRAGRERAHTALRLADTALTALRALPGPLGAVARLHVPSGGEFDRWDCAGCDGCCDRPAWPCATVDLIGTELGITLPDSWALPNRDPEPLDAPIPPAPTTAIVPGTDDFFIRVHRPEAFVNLTGVDPD